MPTHSEKLWSVQDLSDYLGVPVATLYSWRRSGYGPRGRRIGRHLRYRPEDVRRWVENQNEEGE